VAKEDARAILPGTNPVACITEATGCKWPVGSYPHHWCNAPVREGASWCQEHSLVAFQQDVKALKPREGSGTFKSLGGALQGAFKCTTRPYPTTSKPSRRCSARSC